MTQEWIKGDWENADKKGNVFSELWKDVKIYKRRKVKSKRRLKAIYKLRSFWIGSFMNKKQLKRALKLINQKERINRNNEDHLMDALPWIDPITGKIYSIS